jgi:hypothetical protein
VPFGGFGTPVIATGAHFLASAAAALLLFHLFIPILGFRESSELSPLVPGEGGRVGHRFRVHVKNLEAFHHVEQAPRAKPSFLRGFQADLFRDGESFVLQFHGIRFLATTERVFTLTVFAVFAQHTAQLFLSFALNCGHGEKMYEFGGTTANGFVKSQRPKSTVKSIDMISEGGSFDLDRVYDESTDRPTAQAQTFPTALTFALLSVNDHFETTDFFLPFPTRLKSQLRFPHRRLDCRLSTKRTCAFSNVYAWSR